MAAALVPPSGPRTRRRSLSGLASFRHRSPAPAPTASQLGPASSSEQPEDNVVSDEVSAGKRAKLGALLRSLRPRASATFRRPTADPAAHPSLFSSISLDSSVTDSDVVPHPLSPFPAPSTIASNRSPYVLHHLPGRPASRPDHRVARPSTVPPPVASDVLGPVASHDMLALADLALMSTDVAASVALAALPTVATGLIAPDAASAEHTAPAPLATPPPDPNLFAPHQSSMPPRLSEQRRAEREHSPSREPRERPMSTPPSSGVPAFRVEPVEIHPVTDGSSNPPARSSSVRRPSAPGAMDGQVAGPSTVASPSRAHGSSSKRQQRVIGDYFLGKTLGAGSMGKVKLGSHVKTGSKVAIKIIPRVPPDAHRHLAEQAHANHNRQPLRSDGSPATPPPPLPTDSFVAKAIAKEESKEVRTIREAAIMMLLHHPHICGMKEMVVHTNHYYMMFELVSGGQMLDYIISHGRLRERAARKFARQIGSALEYCHRNSIVHRDLKIENILISSTGNIKIIDFGLSNLFSPFTQLSTFCGSLYFAAPELLNAKVYTGPEVDVWSFGIVLYVLVCGKVPFDDQSMPALHAKIKRGMVEYPPWLSLECKQILQRMLVTNPAYRAPLSEVMSHPWMTKGFDGPPEAHLVPREPLRADELDWRVIEGMTGFEFGSADDIEQRLRDVLEGDAYRTALAAWEQRKAGVRGGPDGWKNQPQTQYDSSASLSISERGLTHDAGSQAGLISPTSKKTKRASGFDFFKKKLFSSSSAKEDKAANATASAAGSNGNGAHVNGVTGIGAQAFGEAVQDPLDPTRGFHPLISIYYLVREKMERERVYGPGHFASSDMSLPTSADLSAQQPQPLINYAAASAAPMSAAPALPPKSASARPMPGPDYSMALPRLPAPASSVPSASSRMPSVDLGTRVGPTPRARAGLDEPGLGDPAVVMQHPSADEATTRLVLPPSPAGPSTPTTPNLPRAPSAATHRRSQSLSQANPMASPRTLAEAPKESSVHSSFFYDSSAAQARPLSVQIDRPTAGVDAFTQPSLPPTAEDDEAATSEASPVATMTTPLPAPLPVPAAPSPEGSGNSTSLAKRFGSILSRSPEEQAKRSAKRQSMTLPRSFSRGTTNGLDNAAKDLAAALPDPGNIAAVEPLSQSAPLEGSPIADERGAASTLGPDAAAATLNHSRRTSVGGATVGRSATVTAGTRRASGQGHQQRPSTVLGEPADWVSQAAAGQALSVQDETAEVSAQRNSHRTPDASRLDVESTKDEFKPIYLKGLFSVATTSTRSASALSVDIQRVLNTLGVQYRPLRGGFECVHSPSIDLASVVPSAGLEKRPSIKRKSSKLSFGKKVDETSPPSGPVEPSPSAADSPSAPTLGRASSPSPLPLSPPVSPVRGSTHRIPADRHDSLSDDEANIWGSSPTRTTSMGRRGSAIGGADLGANGGGVSEMVVRFEIMVIKVPWLPLHGVQFRRVGGNAWQYQMLAKRILSELKL